MSQPISTPRPTFTAKPIFTQALMIWLIIFEISSETFNYIHVALHHLLRKRCLFTFKVPLICHVGFKVSFLSFNLAWHNFLLALFSWWTCCKTKIN